MKSKKLLKKGGTNVGNILVQENIFVIETTNLYEEISRILGKELVINIKKIKNFLEILNGLLVESRENIFKDIANLVIGFSATKNFQSKLYTKIDDKGKPYNTDVFGKYELFRYEDPRKFITIDPTIIQIMIFDDEDILNDIVYSLKLIIRRNGELTLRYTTQLFPENSKITTLDDLSGFNTFNTSLGNSYISEKYNEQLVQFLKKYIKFYNFYKKCYLIDDKCDTRAAKSSTSSKKLIDYQLKYISILGKARFGDAIIQTRSALLTDYIMSNLIFLSPTCAFISGGYKGFKQNNYGITRSGYEMAKKYNRPILTIMCKEGMHDSHQYSDAELIYGEHWGEDSIALSQLTDGAIIIAPFGGWTYIECLTLLANKKIIGIYNDFYNILNYEEIKVLEENERIKVIEEERKEFNTLTTDELIKQIANRAFNKASNINFFKFTLTEQNNIINYYINYYLILLYLSNQDFITVPEQKKVLTEEIELFSCLQNAIKTLMYLKTLLPSAKKANALNDEFILLINIFNNLKTRINKNVYINLETLNYIYYQKCTGDVKYQNKIPKKCDGIWIKPIFDLIHYCITPKINTGGKKGGTITDLTLLQQKISEYKIDMPLLNTNPIFNNLNNNIIFVFSDVMYLNSYINTNLSTSYFQEQLHQKIKNLSIARINDKKKISTTKVLLKKESQKYIHLNRNIDGILDTTTKQIINDHILREKYSFIINEQCNNYTRLLT